MAAAEDPWLLLLHTIPAKPDYLRVKVWRRMQRVGAVAIKNSVWALPNTPEAMEDFRWLLQEIVADGGEGVLCEATFLAGLGDAQKSGLEELALRARSAELPASTDPRTGGDAMKNVVWVTRAGIGVDRMASAWLIQRFVDPEARFKFVDPKGYIPAAGETRFDMFEAEYTHAGDSCTFEVLASTFAPGDAAVAAIAEVVHDIDLKESRYNRAETPGVALLVNGIRQAHASDEERLARGFDLFGQMYAALSPSVAPARDRAR
jgi:hypothetical protein